MIGNPQIFLNSAIAITETLGMAGFDSGTAVPMRAESWGSEHPSTEKLIPLAQKSVLSADSMKYEDQIATFFLEEVFGQTGLYAVDNVWPVGPNIKPWGDFVKQGDLRQINGFVYITHK